MITRTKSSNTTSPSDTASMHAASESLTLDYHPPSTLRKLSQQVDDELDTVAFILAGGRGTRLHPLTGNVCKPAVSFGAHCRIIDFTLSNCFNSGIRRISVLTQYRQQVLIEHLRKAWSGTQQDNSQFIEILPPQYDQNLHGYRGTADAVKQNVGLLRQLSPRNTLILAGDHIYKADYRQMIRHHAQSMADVTVACCEIAVADAKRFGVVECNNSGFITGFEEKPLHPKTVPERPDNAMVSMGIYVFKTSVLLDILSEDTPNSGERLDFGRDIFPWLIENYRVYAYEYDQAQTECYWQDIGTIDSFYEANMQLLQSYPAIDLNDTNWPIRTHVRTVFPARLCVDSKGNNGSVSDSIIASGCVLHGSIIRHSIIFNSVTIDDKTIIENSLVLPGARIGKRCKVRNAIIDTDVILPDGSAIGHDLKQDAMQYHVSRNGISVVGKQLKPTSEQNNHVGSEIKCVTKKSTESSKTQSNRVARLL